METTSINILLNQTLKGKKVKHINRYGKHAILEVESVNTEQRSRQISEDTQANDWYGESVSWEVVILHFVDGSSIEVKLTTTLYIVD